MLNNQKGRVEILEESIRAVKMVEEEKLFLMIRSCCSNILLIMKDDEDVKMLTTKKQRIDPSNYAEILLRCEEVLTGDKLALVRKLKVAIDTSLAIVVERYMKWGLAHGEREGARLGVDPIEAKSCACMALYRAAFTYKPGNGFANYAPFWIRQLIQKSVDNRMMTTVDNPLGGDDPNETMKDRIVAGPRFEPSVICEDRQMSDVFRRMVKQLPVNEQKEVHEWWYNDAEITPSVRKFAIEMRASIN